MTKTKHTGLDVHQAVFRWRCWRRVAGLVMQSGDGNPGQRDLEFLMVYAEACK